MAATDLSMMMMAYMRRKRWENDLLAFQVVNRLGEAMGGGKGGSRRSGRQRVPASNILMEAGKEL